jgi:hypothetical protein
LPSVAMVGQVSLVWYRVIELCDFKRAKVGLLSN